MNLSIDWKAVRLEQRFERLANGLAVVAHVDRKSPLVAVLIAYCAGSRDEPAGKAGLAHLCEHLMFTGTRAAPGSYFAPFEQAGAAWMNAYVREDYSAYFATLPAESLEFALKMEADRMIHLAAALDPSTIESQREVVRNELRQREAMLYGCAPRLLAALTRPRDHPYAHPPDGLVEDLDNISIDDVRRWLELNHVPANATLVIAGDLEPATAIDQVRRRFEPLAPGTPPVRPSFGEVAPLAGRYLTQQNEAWLSIAWSGPSVASPDFAAFELACEILGSGRASRLWRRVVENERLAPDFDLELRPRQLGSLAVMKLTPYPDVSFETIEAAIHAEIERLVYQLSQRELDLARLRLFARILRDLERIGGPRSKSDALGLAALAGDPELHDRRISRLATIRNDQIAEGVRRWFAGAGAMLGCVPRARTAEP